MSLAADLKEEALKRLESPILISFSISWVAWNYEFILMLFGDFSTLGKIDFAALNLYPCGWMKFKNWIVLPFGSALIFTLVYPALKNGARMYTQWLDNLASGVISRLNDDAPVPKSIARQIERENRKLKDDMSALKADHEEKVELLNTRREILVKEIAKLESQNGALHGKLVADRGRRFKLHGYADPKRRAFANEATMVTSDDGVQLLPFDLAYDLIDVDRFYIERKDLPYGRFDIDDTISNALFDEGVPGHLLITLAVADMCAVSRLREVAGYMGLAEDALLEIYRRYRALFTHAEVSYLHRSVIGNDIFVLAKLYLNDLRVQQAETEEAASAKDAAAR